MLDTSQFTYRVVYLPQEQSFLAMCDQFNEVTVKAPSYEQAISEIQQSVLQSLNQNK